MIDSVEREYEVAIARAMQSSDSDRAHELSIGLRQYRELYKTTPEEDE